MKEKRQCLVIAYSLLKSREELSHELEAIKKHLDALKRVQFGVQNSIDWHVSLILTDAALEVSVAVLKEDIFAADDNIKIHTELLGNFESPRFNKFAFVKLSIDEMENYNYVMMKDSDMSFEAYPWQSFWTQVVEGGGIITGTLRQSTEER